MGDEYREILERWDEERQDWKAERDALQEKVERYEKALRGIVRAVPSSERWTINICSRCRKQLDTGNPDHCRCEPPAIGFTFHEPIEVVPAEPPPQSAVGCTCKQEANKTRADTLEAAIREHRKHTTGSPSGPCRFDRKLYEVLEGK